MSFAHHNTTCSPRSPPPATTPPTGQTSAMSEHGMTRGPHVTHPVCRCWRMPGLQQQGSTAAGSLTPRRIPVCCLRPCMHADRVVLGPCRVPAVWVVSLRLALRGFWCCLLQPADHETFESTDAGASLTYPQQAGTIRKNGFMVIKGRPCKVRTLHSQPTAAAALQQPADATDSSAAAAGLAGYLEPTPAAVTGPGAHRGSNKAAACRTHALPVSCTPLHCPAGR